MTQSHAQLAGCLEPILSALHSDLTEANAVLFARSGQPPGGCSVRTDLSCDMSLPGPASQTASHLPLSGLRPFMSVCSCGQLASRIAPQKNVEHKLELLQGAQSGPLWCDWAIMEQRQGDRQLCRYLFSKSLEALPRGRFTYLSWATFEQQDGQLDNAQRLLERGHQLNQREPAILQVGGRVGMSPLLGALW